MKIMKTFLLLTIAALTMAMAIPIQAAQEGTREEAMRIQESIRVLNEGMDADSVIPASQIKNAAAVAIVPKMVKGALVVGAERGSGVMLVQEERGRWSDPIFISVSGASLGPQIGVESTDLVMVFNTRKSVNDLLEGQVKLGADATVAAGDLDASIDADTSEDVLTYKRTGGAFAGASLTGAVVQVEEDANENYYGVENIIGAQIIAGLDRDVPDTSEQLKDALMSYIRDRDR